ncbi:MAG TPA: glycosyltransferase [Leptolyngbyaceae cyanobacterium]
MENATKPKLVFFQFKHDQTLREFILLHRQQHIKCLLEFFDVTVINEDCDYEEVCDRYQPDLALFESGVNYKSIHRLDIKNTSAYPKIPKLGLHNGDSWCEARSGFLSDMECWGIETFFSICTTTAEYTPEIAENLFVWPNFIDPDIYKDYHQPKNIPVLMTGYSHSLYPWRQNITKIITSHYPSLICPHPTYVKDSGTPRGIYGEQYARTINASWFVPSCGTIAREVVRKHLEIPASKSCLLTEKTASIEAAGFIDMQNCVFADGTNVLDKLDYLFQNLDELEKIIDAGYKLVHSRHTLKHRDQILQWFKLYKNLQEDQKIIQSNPFEPLCIVGKLSDSQNKHIICDGLILDLLRRGDEKLWAGKYEEAEALYFQCNVHISWMPEPKLRLALCYLYRGDPAQALDWIWQPIRYTLEEYRAKEPDPVEWAYYIIILLCQGNLDAANQHCQQFPSLNHPELERTRLAIEILRNEKNQHSSQINCKLKVRYSVHQLPDRSFSEWIDRLCLMLGASGQFNFSKKLKKSVFTEDKDFSRINFLTQQLKLDLASRRYRLSEFIKSNLKTFIRQTSIRKTLVYLEKLSRNSV